MGKQKAIKRGYNWRARENKDVQIISKKEDEVQIDLEEAHFDLKGIGEDNPLILPAKKRKTVVQKVIPEKKLLGRKERKRLQGILNKKEKKDKRAGLLEALSKVQASSEDMKHFVSTQEMHSKGWKNVNRSARSETEVQAVAEGSIKTVKGANKKGGSALEKTESSDDESSEESSSSESEKEEEDSNISDEEILGSQKSDMVQTIEGKQMNLELSSHEA